MLLWFEPWKWLQTFCVFGLLCRMKNTRLQISATIAFVNFTKPGLLKDFIIKELSFFISMNTHVFINWQQMLYVCLIVCFVLQHADASRVPAQRVRHSPGQVSDADCPLQRVHPVRGNPAWERRISESLPQAGLQETLPDSACHPAAAAERQRIQHRRLKQRPPKSLTSRLHLQPTPHTYLYIYSSKRRLVGLCAWTCLWYWPSGDSAHLLTTQQLTTEFTFVSQRVQRLVSHDRKI